MEAEQEQGGEQFSWQDGPTQKEARAAPVTRHPAQHESGHDQEMNRGFGKRLVYLPVERNQAERDLPQSPVQRVLFLSLHQPDEKQSQAENQLGEQGKS